MVNKTMDISNFIKIMKSMIITKITMHIMNKMLFI
jgi:hypothetical protein